jgi:hypothetical protein
LRGSANAVSSTCRGNLKGGVVVFQSASLCGLSPARPLSQRHGLRGTAQQLATAAAVVIGLSDLLTLPGDAARDPGDTSYSDAAGEHVS